MGLRRKGEGKRPDKGDSDFVPWLDNDATPVINQMYDVQEKTMIENTLKNTIRFSEKWEDFLDMFCYFFAIYFCL